MDFNRPLEKSSAFWLKSGVMLASTVYFVYSYFINYVRPDVYDEGRWMPLALNGFFVFLSLQFPKSFFNTRYSLFSLIGLVSIIGHYTYLTMLNNHEMNYSVGYALVCTFCILLLTHYYQVLVFALCSYAMSVYIGSHVTWLDPEVYGMLVVSTIFGTSFSTCVKIYLINKKNQALSREKSTREKMFASSKFTLLGEISSGLGHEINNPLMIISTYLQMLEIQAPQTKECKETIDTIQGQVMRIGNITKSLKEFVDTDRSVAFEFPLLKAIKDSLSILDNKIKQENVNIEILEKNVSVSAKAPEISQIIVNLISNSIDALSSQPKKDVKISIEDKKEELLLKVWDNGHGIELKNREKVFVPFFTTKDPNKGSGIGLSISKQLALKNNCDLYLEESGELGTCFILKFNKEKVLEEVA